jgi:hypothetical protein
MQRRLAKLEKAAARVRPEDLERLRKENQVG